MKKILLSSAAVFLFSVTACTTSTPVDGDATDETSSSSSSTITVDSSSSSVATSDSSAEQDGASQSSESSTSSSVESSADTSPTARVVEVSVTDWSFTPSTITAKKGELLELRFVTDDGEHSFTSVELNLNVALAAGETKVITIPTDVVGTFSFRCMVPCGPGHKDMKGEIVITE
ncbi:MAG TPA: cupredoxin domain-containing protein [Candidatus Peribacterales bacterium]|nr:cupredoxin domain-containing protein [Candidatus Peribacterales bacterium]